MVWRRAEDLVDYYAEDFTRDTFNICPSDLLKRLRDCLRENGIYVRKGRGVQIANELYKAVHEDSPWPDDDTDKRSCRPRFWRRGICYIPQEISLHQSPSFISLGPAQGFHSFATFVERIRNIAFI
jgi:hypothetical protein